MATEIIVTLNGKELKAKPITFGDWEFLGQYLKSRLLLDLKLVDDPNLRRDLQMNIQNRDFDATDVVNCKRLDVIYKILYIIFGHNTGMTEGAVKALISDDHIFDVIKSVYEASGIKFVKENEENPDTEEVSEVENPTSSEKETDETKP